MANVARLFAVGDVVFLRSGSPAMSIELVKGKVARCVWYSSEEWQFMRDDFPLECLEDGTDLQTAEMTDEDSEE